MARLVRLEAQDDFVGWRDAARALATRAVAPEQVVWQVGDRTDDLFGRGAGDVPVVDAPPLSVPRGFVDLARRVILHRDPERFALLYALLLKVVAAPHMVDDRTDPLVRRIADLDRAVRRDIHKMRAFVRFREMEEPEGSRMVAWFEPDHHILRANAGFFVDRFTQMRWSILTPEGSIHWDGALLTEGPPARRTDAPAGDPLEAVWKAYYAAIFNPARLMTNAMLKEMPKKYWKNMPETALIPELIAGARKRERGMIEEAEDRPARTGGNGAKALELLREEAAHCRRCPLWKPATQTVFGEGPRDAAIMIVGEQPGDMEDLAGRPFVGPAGQLFDRAMAAAGVDRGGVYVTNAVKHFKFEPRGKRRIHAKPNAGEIEACRWWIDQERAIVRPRTVIALGATAARSLLGRTVTISRERGRAIALDNGAECWITVHPSYLLRLPDKAAAEAEYERFVEDLRQAARVGMAA